MIDRMKVLIGMATLLLLGALMLIPSAVAGGQTTGAKSDSVLKAAEVGPKLLPDKVFFGGQVAPVQMRNAGGVHFSVNSYTLAALVDSAGYSAEARQKYQGYLLSEVALEIQGHKLPAGAYGIGFLKDGKFVVMDIGAHDVIEAKSSQDAEMKRPVPLQVTGSSTAGQYRLYVGRDFVEWKRTQ